MGEKKVREAIEELKAQIQIHEKIISENEDCKLLCVKLREKIEQIETAIEALEKQLPKKPQTSKAYYGCPDCATIRSLRQKHNYCHDCGQRLDWSE